jgi:PST family polysaccharide transporter
VQPADSSQADQAFERRVFKGGQSLIASQIIRGIFRAISAFLVVRLLTPVDYGIFGMALVLYGMVYAVRDLGLTTAAVSADQLGPEKLTRVFCTSAAFGGILALLFAAASPVAANWNSEHRLVPVMLELSLAFLLNGLGTAPQVLLNRELKFVTLSRIEVLSAAVSIGIAIACAFAGWGYWSLVHMTVAAELVRTAGSWWAARWRPQDFSFGPGMQPLLMIGLAVAGFTAISTIASSCDQFLVGLWFGAESLGLYGRAAQFTLLPSHFVLAPLSGWMVAALSRLKAQPERFRTLNSQVTNAVAHAIYPFAALLIAAPAAVIELFLGHTWVAAAPILRWLALGLLVQPLICAQNWLMMSHGRGQRLCVIAAASLVVLLTLSFCLRSHEATGIAAAVAATALIALPGVAWAVKGSPVSVVHDLLQPLRLPAILFLLVAAVTFAALNLLSHLRWSGPAALAAGFAFWLFVVASLRPLRRELATASRAFFAGSGKL